MSASPTARTLDWLREQGYRAQVVERFNSFSGKRTDLFGCIDILAVNDAETLGVQATSGANVNARVQKIVTECRDDARAWLACSTRMLCVVGWTKYKKPLDGKYVRPIVKRIGIAMLDGRA